MNDNKWSDTSGINPLNTKRRRDLVRVLGRNTVVGALEGGFEGKERIIIHMFTMEDGRGFRELGDAGMSSNLLTSKIKLYPLTFFPATSWDRTHVDCSPRKDSLISIQGNEGLGAKLAWFEER